MSLSALGVGVMEWWGGGWLWASGARCLGGGRGPMPPPPKGMTHFDGLAPFSPPRPPPHVGRHQCTADSMWGDMGGRAVARGAGGDFGGWGERLAPIRRPYGRFPSAKRKKKHSPLRAAGGRRARGGRLGPGGLGVDGVWAA